MKQFINQITLDEMRGELAREVAMRKKVYPRWIELGKINEYDANLQLLKMQACLAYIEAEIKKNSAQGDLFQ